MVTLSEVRKQIVLELSNEWKDLGFKWASKYHDFYRVDKNARFRFHFNTYVYNQWEFHPFLYVLIFDVEKIFNEISPRWRNNPNSGITVGSPLGYLMDNVPEEPVKTDKNYRYLYNIPKDVTHKKSIRLMVADCNQKMREFAIPFYEKYQDIYLLDKILNSDVKMETSISPDLHFKSVKGLIIRHLCGANNIEELIKNYEEACKNNRDEEDKKEFYAVVDYVLKH